MNLNMCVRYRLFSTSLAVLASGKEARVMNKLLKRSSKKRTWFPSKDVSATSLQYHFHPQKERNSRRVTVLNKLFMKYISDLMSTGEISREIASLRLEISKVKISPDFGTLNVYWVTRGTSIDEDVEDTLMKNAGKLKHELTQLRVIGNVPTINFVKDSSLNKIAEVDALLTKADFGDDFEPTDPSLHLLSELTISTKLPPEIQEKILDEDGFVDEEPLPPMAMNILGLDQDVIMQKILRAKNKSHALHRHMSVAPSQSIYVSANEAEIPELKSTEKQSPLQGNEASVTVQNSDLKKFVAKRMALHRKMSQASKSHLIENELLTGVTELQEADEDHGDYDLLYKNSHGLKELETDIDDFDDIIEGNNSWFYGKENS